MKVCEGTVGLVIIVFCSRLSLMVIASASQYHIYFPWGQCPFSIVVEASFKQEKALVGVFPVITNLHL